MADWKENIAKIRRDSGLSQDEFADIFGVSRNTVKYIEEQRAKSIDPYFAMEVARYFNMDLNELLGFDENQSTKKVSYSEMTKKKSSSTKKKREDK